MPESVRSPAPDLVKLPVPVISPDTSAAPVAILIVRVLLVPPLTLIVVPLFVSNATSPA